MTSVSPRAIEIARIDVSGRLRGVNPGAVAAYQEERERGSEPPPIKIVVRGDGFKLINGLQRLEAARAFGSTILADVRDEEEFPTDAHVRRAEIIDNFMHCELTKLERAVHLAEWKAIFTASNTVAGHGGRRAGAGRKIKSQELRNCAPDAGVAAFVTRFSLAAAQFLGISERSVQLAIHIANNISPAIRVRIALTEIAQSQSELIELARHSEQRQQAILGLLLAEPAAAHSVAEAVAVLDRVPLLKLEGWRRLSNVFSKMKPAEQRAFFEAHADDFRAWLAECEATSSRKAA